MDTYTLLAKYITCYPAMQPEDCIKLLYQSYLGPEHAINDRQSFTSQLVNEMALPDVVSTEFCSPEPIGHGLCRVHLMQALDLQAETIASLCILAAKQHKADRNGFYLALSQLKEWRGFPWVGCLKVCLASVIDEYIAADCPPIHHSLRYKALYHPHYRIMQTDAAFYLPVFAAIDKVLRQKSHVLIGIDGMSAAGKSTLCALLQQVYCCGAVHTDDFFLQPHQRTDARLNQPGGNIDYERLAPITRQAADDRAFTYQRFDCTAMQLGEERYVPEGRVTILEGVYALHPKVNAACDVRVFLSVDADIQTARILHRSEDVLAQKFFREWIPMENRYFAEFHVRDGCDVKMDTTTL